MEAEMFDPALFEDHAERALRAALVALSDAATPKARAEARRLVKQALAYSRQDQP
jgi:hypothetical protein